MVGLYGRDTLVGKSNDGVLGITAIKWENAIYQPLCSERE